MFPMNKKFGIIIYILLIGAFLLLSEDFYLSKKYYGKEHSGKISFIGPVVNVSSSSFYMYVNHKPLKVYYKNLQKPFLGQIYVLGIVNPDGTANALDVHDLSYNYLKYFISFFALVIFLFIFFKEWKFKKWRFVKNA